MRGAQRRLQIFARAATGIEVSKTKQPAPRRQVDGATPALHIGRKRAAFILTLEPANPQPAQIVIRSLSIDSFASLRVQVLEAHHQRAAGVACPLPRGPERA